VQETPLRNIGLTFTNCGRQRDTNHPPAHTRWAWVETPDAVSRQLSGKNPRAIRYQSCSLPRRRSESCHAKAVSAIVDHRTPICALQENPNPPAACMTIRQPGLWFIDPKHHRDRKVQQTRWARPFGQPDHHHEDHGDWAPRKACAATSTQRTLATRSSTGLRSRNCLGSRHTQYGDPRTNRTLECALFAVEDHTQVAHDVDASSIRRLRCRRGGVAGGALLDAALRRREAALYA